MSIKDNHRNKFNSPFREMRDNIRGKRQSGNKKTMLIAIALIIFFLFYTLF